MQEETPHPVIPEEGEHGEQPGRPEVEKSRFMASLLFPLGFVIILWTVWLLELAFDLELHTWGIFPKEARGLRGIFLSPFLHGDFRHLINNSIPLLVLGTALFYFYRPVAARVTVLSVLITGIWVWVAARPAYHIGASGLIYSLAAFLFTSGIIRKHPRLMALSLLVVFLYGGMVWGVFPVAERISWESHLMGLFSGVLLAIFFRGQGPQRRRYSWELEEGMDEGIPEQDGYGAAGGSTADPDPFLSRCPFFWWIPFYRKVFFLLPGQFPAWQILCR